LKRNVKLETSLILSVGSMKNVFLLTYGNVSMIT